MKTSLLLAAMAAGAMANELPCCEHDGCYRNLIDARYLGRAKSFCPQLLAGTTTNPAAIPTAFSNCREIERLSSACTCVTHGDCSKTTTPASSSTPPTVTSTTTLMSTAPTERSTSTPVDQSTSRDIPESSLETSLAKSTETPTTRRKRITRWTTSTIKATSTRTITKCAGGAPDCDTKVLVTTTETMPVSTTTFPVTEQLTASQEAQDIREGPTAGTVQSLASSIPVGNDTLPPLVAGDARHLGVEAAALVAGVLVVAL